MVIENVLCTMIDGISLLMDIYIPDLSKRRKGATQARLQIKETRRKMFDRNYHVLTLPFRSRVSG